jgi:polyhydroxyalkanoate synthesis regulator phasin
MSNAMIHGRQADSARRRQRVIKALNTTIATGEEISVSALARQAGVDRSFLYRHPDLLAQIRAAQAQPTKTAGRSSVTMASLQADLVNAHDRANRQASRVRQLEKKLSELMGNQAWRESGLGAPDDIEQMKRRITELEQQVVDLKEHLAERDQELEAARGANRDLINQLNRS